MSPRLGSAYLAHVRWGVGYEAARVRVLAAYPYGAAIPPAHIRVMADYLRRAATWSRPDWRADLDAPVGVVLAGRYQRADWTRDGATADRWTEEPCLLHPAELVGEIDDAGAGRTHGTGECPQHGVWIGDRCYLCAEDATAGADRAIRALRRWEEVLREL